jgi:DNA-binding response OmpR family regulator
MLSRSAAQSRESERFVLVIEDEEDVRNLLRLNLKKAGFRVLEAEDGIKGLLLARDKQPHLILLDLMLPNMSGEEVCRELKARESTAKIPIIMLTAKARPEDRVAGLEMGADDYVSKPFSPRELVLRVEALMRRVEAAGLVDLLRVGPFELDRGAFAVRISGKSLDLTALEFKLLAMLLEKRGQVLSRELLLREVWGYKRLAQSRTVDTHMRRLRSKLGAQADRLETVHGHGYRFVVREDD